MRIKDRSRIKVFEPFEDVFKPSSSIDEMMISYGCVYKKSSKPVMRASRVETIEKARKDYKQLLEKVGRRPVFLVVIFKDKSPLSNALRNNLEDYIHCNSRT